MGQLKVAERNVAADTARTAAGRAIFVNTSDIDRRDRKRRAQAHQPFTKIGRMVGFGAHFTLFSMR